MLTSEELKEKEKRQKRIFDKMLKNLLKPKRHVSIDDAINDARNEMLKQKLSESD